MHLIELEIIRYKLYSNIIYLLKKYLDKYLKIKEIKHLLLRYILNRNIFTKNNNNIGDSLFIVLKNDNKIADKQLEDDFKYFKIYDTSLFNTVNNVIINQHAKTITIIILKEMIIN